VEHFAFGKGSHRKRCGKTRRAIPRIQHKIADDFAIKSADND
jgi:hypothetical protein